VAFVVRPLKILRQRGNRTETSSIAGKTSLCDFCFGCSPQGGRAANQMRATARAAMACSRWSLVFVKKLTIFELSSTGRQGRQPNASYRPVYDGSLPMVASLCEEIHNDLT
jgi:hypothetical protein